MSSTPDLLPLATKAVQEKLAAWERPVVTDHELLVLMSAQLAGLDASAAVALYRGVIDTLGQFGLITPSKDFKPDSVFHLFGRGKPDAMEVACAVDPFSYVSHLSAMEYHGVTDRFSRILYLTTPPDAEWRALAQERMEKDLGQQLPFLQKAKLPLLRRPTVDRIEGVRIELMRRSSRGAFKAIRSPAIRVAMIGRTFLDMVREPANCGGMQHVVDTYRTHAARYLPLIVEEVERQGTAVEKVRAGFLLDEVCHLQHPMVDSWAALAQRGGSRLLDPQGEYTHDFSARWMLSINLASLVPPAPGAME